MAEQPEFDLLARLMDNDEDVSILTPNPASPPAISNRAIPDFPKLRGPIYKMFDWLSDVRLWKCTLCKVTLQHHAKCGSSTLNRHFKDKHPNKLDEITRANQPINNHQAQPALTAHLVKTKPPPAVVTKEGVRKRIVDLIVGADLPFNIVENQLFGDLLNYVSREHPNVMPPPTRTTVKNDINKLYSEELAILKSELSQNNGKISLIVDCWTSSNQNAYQGVVATWIDNDWNMQNCLLDLTSLVGSHTGVNLAKELDKVISDFAIWEKLMAITTDNASNMDTMFEELDQYAIENGSDFSSNKGRVRCLAHIVNLSCKALLATAESYKEEDGETSVAEGVLKKLRGGIRSIRASPQRLRAYESYCKQENLKCLALIRDVSTRWNSTLDMMVRAKEMKLAYNRTVSSCSELSKYKISESEWSHIDQLIDILQPFKETTIVISKERPTLSDTSGSYILLFTHLEKYTESMATPSSSKRSRFTHQQEVYPEWLINSAQAAWEKLRDYYPTSDGLVYWTATVLNPRYKLEWFKALEWDQSSQKEAKKAVTNLWETKYMDTQQQYEDNEPTSSSKSAVMERGDAFELLYSAKMKKFQRSDDELKQYLSEPIVRRDVIEHNNGILGWWKNNSVRFPNLSKMARDVLAVQGTGVSVERFFSSGPDLLNPKRQRLTAQSVKQCLALKAWIKRKNKPENATFLEALRLNKSFGPEYDNLDSDA